MVLSFEIAEKVLAHSIWHKGDTLIHFVKNCIYTNDLDSATATHKKEVLAAMTDCCLGSHFRAFAYITY